MKKEKYLRLNLQLFSENGDSGDAGLSGDNIADAGQNATENIDNEFAELIKGKFKEQFSKKTQEIIDKRFRKTKELEAFKEKISPAVSSLMEKYGLAEGEEEKLFDAINGEESRNMQETEKPSLHREALSRKAASWVMESEEMKASFPDFDLRNEIKEKPVFAQLLLSGVDLKTAYQVAHRDEILSGAMAYTAGKVRQQVVQGIQAKGMRPHENGVMASGAVVTGVDVNSLTSKDILKILKQVENGANISF